MLCLKFDQILERRSFRILLVKRIFQSVGLAPLITSTDQNGTFVSYQDIHTPFRIRNTVLKVKCDYEKHDLQTVGGIL